MLGLLVELWVISININEPTQISNFTTDDPYQMKCLVLANTNRWRILGHCGTATWHLNASYIDLDSVVEDGECGGARGNSFDYHKVGLAY